MAVKSASFGGTDLNELSRGYYQDWNDTFDAVKDCTDKQVSNATESILENSINIAKLQYCQSLTDIDHDYMVVDVFTDSTGYNDTINTTCTTSSFISSALPGHYLNVVQNSISLIAECYGAGGGGSKTYGNFCGCVYSCTNNTYICLCNCNDVIDNACDYITFNIKTTGCIAGSEPTGFTCLCTGPVNYCFGFGGEGSTSDSITFVLLKNSSDCFDVYCNGSCVCETTISSNLVICLISDANADNIGSIWTCSELCDFCVSNLDKTKIVTASIDYATTVSASYLSLDKSGTGTVVYDVYDASSTSTAIATSLAVNTLNSLSCCVQCHIYDIVQCAGDVSCIKSYAVAVTEA